LLGLRGGQDRAGEQQCVRMATTNGGDSIQSGVRSERNLQDHPSGSNSSYARTHASALAGDNSAVSRRCCSRAHSC